MGYPIFFSDQVSKKILVTEPEVVTKIKSLLGDQAYFEDGSINKVYIGSKIFSNQLLLKKMNAIMHPAVRLAFEKWALEQNSNIVFNEAAILFETNGYLQFDKTILVTAPKTTRIERVMNRETITVEAIEKRMANQWTDEQKMPLANYIIKNGPNEMLLPQINEIILDFVKLVD